MTRHARQPVALTRRTVLAGALGAAAGSLPGVAQAAEAEAVPPLPGAGMAFEANTLLEVARARAKVAYVGPKPGDLPAALKGLSREAYEAIWPAEGRGIWAGQDIGYSLEPLLRGSIFDTPVAL